MIWTAPPIFIGIRWACQRWRDFRQRALPFWVKAAPGTYLGLWKPEAGGPGVGVHGSRGGAHVHLAFLVPQGQLEAMEKRLQAAGYAATNWVRFNEEQLSLFVDDPDGNVIEFADWSRSWEGLPVER